MPEGACNQSECSNDVIGGGAGAGRPLGRRGGEVEEEGPAP